MIGNYNSEVESSFADPSRDASHDPKYISWNRNLENDFRRQKRLSWSVTAPRRFAYRPFTAVNGYFEQGMNAMQYQLRRLFPAPDTQNLGIAVMGPRAENSGSVQMVGAIPDLAYFTYAVQFYPRWRYEKVDDTSMFDVHDGEVIEGYRRIDNITHAALAAFTATYPGESITKDDIFNYVYGLLHSSEYRETYAADLKKMLPRIPLAQDFRAFAEAGKSLAALHLGYETVEPYELNGLDVQGPGGERDYGFFAVRDKKMSFGKPTADQKAAGDRYDWSVIHYNERITLRGIPAEAYRYTLGSRSAIEWIMDRYWVKTDKASGIVNNPNDWSREVGDPRYILDLLARIVTVSLETVRIVDALPGLNVQPSTVSGTSA